MNEKRVIADVFFFRLRRPIVMVFLVVHISGTESVTKHCGLAPIPSERGTNESPLWDWTTMKRPCC